MPLPPHLAALIIEVDRRYLNQPYPDQSELYSHPTLFDENTQGKVYRPYHGLLHTLRTIFYLEDILKLFATHARSEPFQQYCKAITDTTKTDFITILAFLVTGRTSESGREEGFAYKYISAKEFSTYVESMAMPTERILLYRNVIERMGNIEDVEPTEEKHFIHHIISLAHMLDLGRIKDKAGVQKRIKPFEKILKTRPASHHHLQLLIEKATLLLIESGESPELIKKRDLSQFCYLSLNPSAAIERLSDASDKATAALNEKIDAFSTSTLTTMHFPDFSTVFYPPNRLYCYHTPKQDFHLLEFNINVPGQMAMYQNTLLLTTQSRGLIALNLTDFIAGEQLERSITLKYGEFRECKFIACDKLPKIASKDNEVYMVQKQDHIDYTGISSDSTIVSGTLHLQHWGASSDDLKCALSSPNATCKSYSLSAMIHAIDNVPYAAQRFISTLEKDHLLVELIIDQEDFFSTLKSMERNQKERDQISAFINEVGPKIGDLVSSRIFLHRLMQHDSAIRAQILSHIPDGHFSKLLPRSPAIFCVEKYIQDLSIEEKGVILKKFGIPALKQKYPSPTLKNILTPF